MEKEPNETFLKPELSPEEENNRNSELMREAGSLDELRTIIIEKRIMLHGSKQDFSAEMLADTVDKIKSGAWPLSMATRAGDFRDLVKMLARKEGIEIFDDEETPEDGKWRI